MASGSGTGTPGAADRARSAAAPVRRRQERSKATRDALLTAALDEFSRLGFEGASTRRIADRAGVSLPSIRHHFGSKEDLWKATVERVHGGFITRLERRREGLEGVGEETLVRLLLREYILFFAETPQFARFLIQVNHGPPDLLEWLAARFIPGRRGWYNELLRRAQAAGFFPEGDIFLLRFLFLGAATSIFVFGPTISRLLGLDPTDESVVEEHLELVLNMFVGPPVVRPSRPGLV